MVDVATIRIVIDGSQAQGQAGRITADIQRMGDAGTRAERQVGGLSSTLGAFARVAGLAGAAVGGISFARVVTETASYERQLSSLKAVSQATSAEMMQFSETARQLGATTAFSATEAAQGMEALASAGQNTGQILQSIGPALALASAGSLTLAESAELGASTLNQFSLSADNFQRVADVLADAAAAGATNVAQLGNGLRQSGTIAAQAGLSFEETAASLTALADAGLRGEQGGTAFRGVIASLINPSGEAAKVLDRLGITGATVAEKLQQLGTSNISAADAFKVFGTEAAGAGQILARDADKVSEYAERFKNAEGAVDAMAATIEDNLTGDLKALTSALSEAALQVGGDSGFNTKLRELTQSFTEFISTVNELPKEKLLAEQKRYWDELFDVANLNGFREALSAFVDEARVSIPRAFANLPETLARLSIEFQHRFKLIEITMLETWAKSKAAGANAMNALVEIAQNAGTLIKNAFLSAIASIIDAFARIPAALSSSLQGFTGDSTSGRVLSFFGLDEAAIQSGAAALDSLASSVRGAAGDVRGLRDENVSLTGILRTAKESYDAEAQAIDDLFQKNRDLANSERALSMLRTTEITQQHELRQTEIIRVDALERLDKGLTQYAKTTGGLTAVTNEYFKGVEAAIKAEEKGYITTQDRIRIVDSYAGELQNLTVQLENTAGKHEKAETSASRTKPTIDNLSKSTGNLAKQAREAAREQSNLAREIEQLESAYRQIRGEVDPLWRATEEYLDKVDKLAENVAVGNISMREMDEIVQKLALNLDKQVEAAQRAADGNKTASEEVSEAWKFAANAIDDLFTSLWRSLIDGSKSVGDTLKEWFVGLLAQLAQAAFRNAIVIPIVGQFLGGGASGIAQATSLLGGGFNPFDLFGSGPGSTAQPGSSGFGSTGGFGSFFGGNSISTGINGVTGNLWGLGAASVSNIGLLGAGIAGGFIGDQLFGGQYGGTGGSIGASAGAVIGSAIMPVIGTAIGAIIGALAGGALGSLFGGDYEPYPYQLVQVGGGGLPIGDSPNITRGDVVTGASGLTFQAVSKHQDLAGAQALQDELLMLDSILAAVAPNAGLAGENLGDFGATLDGVLAGLDGYQDSDIDITEKFVREWLKAADVIDERARDLVLSMEGNGRELAASFAALTTLFEYMDLSPTEAYQEALEATQMTLWDATAAQRDYIIELMASFDGTPEQLGQLAAAVAARYEMELAMIAQIMQMIQGVEQLGQSAVDQFRLSVMSDQQRFEFFSMQAEQLRASLANLTDPTQIWEAFQGGIAAQQNAFNLLSQEQQAMVVDQFVRWTEEFQQEATDLLADQAAQIENENATLSAVIGDALADPANTMAEAAAAMQQAAGVMQAALAAGLPIQVVTVYINEGESQLGYG